MALPLSNTGEGGSNTTTVSTANSGGTSGNAYDGVTIGAGATVTFSTTQAAHGTLGYAVGIGATFATSYMAWTTTSFGTISTTIYFRFYLYLPAAAATAAYPFQFVTTNTRGPGLRVNTSRALQWANGTTAVGTASTNLIPTGQWVRIEGQILPSTTVMAGSAKIYSPLDSTTDPGAAGTASCSAVAGNMASVNGVRIGWQSDGPVSATTYFDDINVNTTGLPGPAVSAAVFPQRNVMLPSAASMRAATR